MNHQVKNKTKKASELLFIPTQNWKLVGSNNKRTGRDTNDNKMADEKKTQKEQHDGKRKWRDTHWASEDWDINEK